MLYAIFSTYVMDEFPLQEANRFQGEQVVKQESVGIFESTDDTSKRRQTDALMYCWGGQCWSVMSSVQQVLQAYLWASTRACEALSSV